jgi:hypothetical protein
MDNQMKNDNHKFDYEIPRKLEFQNGADATGMWFAAAVFFAVLAAAVIVYRNSDSDIRTAANDTMPAAAQQSDPIAPAPMLQQR